MRLFHSYLHWYHQIFTRILQLYRNLILFPIYYFSIPFHIKTLLSPWKRQTFHMRPGFSVTDFLTELGFNMTSVCIGLLIKTITIIYGLLISLVIAITGIVPILGWVLCIGILPLYIMLHPEQNKVISLLKHAHSDIRILLLQLLSHPEGKYTIEHLGIDRKKMHDYILQQPPSHFTEFNMLFQSLKKRSSILQISDLLEVLARIYTPFQLFLEGYKLTSEDILTTSQWYEMLFVNKQVPLLFDFERLKKIPGIGISWSYGYTPKLDQYSSDLTKTQTTFPYLMGRENELLHMQKILIKSYSNNVLIIGEPGTARHMMVKTLAYRIISGNTLSSLSHKRLVSLDMHALTSSKPSILEVKGFISEILTEADSAGNVIIFVDEFDKYVVNEEGKIDLTDIFEKFAESPMNIIGITTPSDYHKSIQTNDTLSKLFEKIEVTAPSYDVVMDELKVSIVPIFEKKYSVIITYPALKQIIENSSRYLTSTPFPGKAIELLEQSVVFTISDKKRNCIFASDVDEFLSHQMNIPIGQITEVEKGKLTHMESLLHEKIIAQDRAISAIASSLRRSRTQVSSPKRPIGSFLFFGPTGVGKTETAKALAEIYFGSQEKILRFDMSQYQKNEGIERLIGSVKLGNAGELITNLKDNPYAVLLFDEIEKADKDILNLLLPLLDEGYISDHTGKRVDARNTIIIATSNAGSEFIRESTSGRVNPLDLQKEVIDFILQQHIFTPEFLNRFDELVVFSPLSEGQLREVTKLKLVELNNRLARNHISVAITDNLVKKLALVGFHSQFGGRSIDREIHEHVEDLVAKQILEKKMSEKGEMLYLDY